MEKKNPTLRKGGREKRSMSIVNLISLVDGVVQCTIVLFGMPREFDKNT